MAAALDLMKALKEANTMIADICLCGHTKGEHECLDLWAKDPAKKGVGSGQC